MRKIYKTFLASALLLMLQVSAAFAVNVTYVLERHTDVPAQYKTITATANDLSAGASLEDNMPQTLWRAYCTYKYYSDAAKTQEVTSVSDDVSTVYVDYVFDPPFILTSEDGDPIWHYIRTYNSSSNNYVMYLKKDNYPSTTNIHGWKNNPPSSVYPTGNSGGQMMYPGDADWAFYGDAYDFHIRINNDDSALGNKRWMIWSSTTSAANLTLGARPTLGWQLFINKTQRQDNNYNWYNYYTMALNVPGTDYYAALRDVNSKLVTSLLESDYRLDSKHQIEPKATSGSNLSSIKRNMWWYGFYATPVGSGKDLNYHVTYRILMHDGNWYSDIVKSQIKSGSKQYISFPTEYTKKTYCTYDMFYKDEAFTEKYPDPYQMPNTENLVVYIKEVLGNAEPFVTDHWITLVLSYNVNNLENEWGYAADGVTPAVRVLEYTALTTNASNTKYALTFTKTDKIEAHKPYLFKADEVLEGKYLSLSKDPNWGDKTQEELDSYVGNKKVTKKDNAHNSPDVTMIGTYYDKGLTVLSEHPNLLYFYFGYDKSYDREKPDDYVGDEAAAGKYPYNFYRVTKNNVTMPKHRCYFMIEGASAEAKFMLMDNFGEEISGVEGFEVERIVPTGRIYNLNGQVVGNDLEALPRGVYIVNGKKVMK